MGTQVTTNYGWVYPNPFEEDDAWGPILNALFVDVDADLKAVADSKAGLSTSNTFTAASNTFGSGSGIAQVFVNGGAGSERNLVYQTNGSTRWIAQTSGTAEAGSNAGSNYLVSRFNDAGVFVDIPFQITRSNGLTTIKELALTTDLAVTHGGTGASDAAGARTNLGLGALATLSTVGAAEITDGAVGTAELANASVTTAKVADAAITAAKLAAGVIPEAFPAGTKMLFQQTNAPTGWTKDTTHNNKALRVVNGTVGTGGAYAFTDVFAAGRVVSGSTSSNTISASVDYHTLSWNEMPAHTHDFPHYGGSGGGGTSSGGTSNYRTTTSAGSSWGHTHGFSQSAHGHTFSGSLEMNVAYVDLIIATKD